MTQTATAARTFYRVESRIPSGTWTKRWASVRLNACYDKVSALADEAPHLDWRIASGSPFGDARSPLEIHGQRPAR